ncbi:hypothetical protein DFJ73DRAFT_763629 [Zopfochytrium polystomum]|nr:hypothetical protein DFJ73DRAFT_763629 [Zopfochytrium polystomum]
MTSVAESPREAPPTAKHIPRPRPCPALLQHLAADSRRRKTRKPSAARPPTLFRLSTRPTRVHSKPARHAAVAVVPSSVATVEAGAARTPPASPSPSTTPLDEKPLIADTSTLTPAWSAVHAAAGSPSTVTTAHTVGSGGDSPDERRKSPSMRSIEAFFVSHPLSISVDADPPASSASSSTAAAPPQPPSPSPSSAPPSPRPASATPSTPSRWRRSRSPSPSPSPAAPAAAAAAAVDAAVRVEVRQVARRLEQTRRSVLCEIPLRYDKGSNFLDPALPFELVGRVVNTEYASRVHDLNAHLAKQASVADPAPTVRFYSIVAAVAVTVVAGAVAAVSKATLVPAALVILISLPIAGTFYAYAGSTTLKAETTLRLHLQTWTALDAPRALHWSSRRLVPDSMPRTIRPRPVPVPWSVVCEFVPRAHAVAAQTYETLPMYRSADRHDDDEDEDVHHVDDRGDHAHADEDGNGEGGNGEGGHGEAPVFVVVVVEEPNASTAPPPPPPSGSA